MQIQPTCFGFPQEWEAFNQTHKAFLEKLPYLLDLTASVFVRDIAKPTQADLVVFLLGNSVKEEFMEVLLLCGNGYGLGAMRLLRAMYERAVTMAYIAANPTEATRFVRYYPVHRMKHWNHAKELYGEGKLPPLSDSIKADFEVVRNDYMEVICKTCDKKRPLGSWTLLSLDAMARKAGPQFKELYLSCSYEPTLLIHTTMSAIFSQLDGQGLAESRLEFDSGPQRATATRGLEAAHSLLVLTLDVQNRYFTLGLDARQQQSFEDFMSVWKPEQQDSTQPEGSASNAPPASP